MTGAPEGSPKVVLCGFYVFMEKPGIEPATPGLQGIALIHYTTGASHQIYQWERDRLIISHPKRKPKGFGSGNDLCINGFQNKHVCSTC